MSEKTHNGPPGGYQGQPGGPTGGAPGGPAVGAPGGQWGGPSGGPPPSQWGGAPGGYQGGDPKAQAAADKAYRKAQRPLYKKKRVILPAGFLALIVLIAMANSGGSSNSASTSASGQSCTADYPDKQKKDTCADASGSLTVSDLTVQASGLAAVADKYGTSALCSNVVITNKSGKSQDYNIWDFKVQTPSGAVDTGSAANMTSTLDSGALINGGVKQGMVCTEDKGERGQYVMIYKPNSFASDRGVWLSTV